MNKSMLWIATVALTFSIVCMADEPAKGPRSRLLIMLQTQVVSGKKLNGPADEYVDDNNPNTIELVALPKNDTGPSRVSANGQVIFLTQKDLRSAAINEALMDQAFDIIEKKEADAAKPM